MHRRDPDCTVYAEARKIQIRNHPFYHQAVDQVGEGVSVQQVPDQI